MGTPNFSTVYEVVIDLIPSLSILPGEKIQTARSKEEVIFVVANSLPEALSLGENYAEMVIAENAEGDFYFSVTSVRAKTTVFLGSEDEIDRALAKLEDLEGGGKPN